MRSWKDRFESRRTVFPGKLATIAVKAEDTYMPSGPPKSPLTGSYFFCWVVFDAAVGASRPHSRKSEEMRERVPAGGARGRRGRA